MSEALSAPERLTGRYPSLGEGEPPLTATGRPACERSLNWDGLAPHCGRAAAVLTRAMCVHEHYGEGHACLPCLAAMRGMHADGEWMCEDCLTGPDPHDCPMPVQVIPLEVPGD